MPILPSSRAASAAITESAWPPVLTIARAVAYTGCSRSTLNRAIHEGSLPLYGRIGKHGHLRCVRREDCDRWLAGDVGGSDDDAAIATRRPMPAKADTSAALARIKAAARSSK
jgi:excisionase family DNA binding protein